MPDLRHRRGAALVAAALVVVGGILAARSLAVRTTSPSPAASPASSSSASRSPVVSRTWGKTFAFQLSTHCGVDEARVGNVYFAADEPLIGPGYDPPPGWVNPYQPGTMTPIDAAHAVFRDDLGHTLHFHARAGATGFARPPCD